MKSAATTVMGMVVMVLAGYVLAGMLNGADPDFERGRSPTKYVVLQEVLGALTFLTLLAVALQLRGAVTAAKPLAPAVATLLGAFVLAAIWSFAYGLQRAS